MGDRQSAGLHAEARHLMPGNRARFAAVESRLSVCGVLAVPLSVDMRKIVKAEVVPEEIEIGRYGIAWETEDGEQGCNWIGTKADAEKIVQDIVDRKVVAFNGTLVRTDG